MTMRVSPSIALRGIAPLALVALLGHAASADLTVTLTSSPSGGQYQPKNIVAVWIEDAGGNFVKTIGRWAATRKQYLVAWNQKAGTNDVDAVSGATRTSHLQPLIVKWNLRDRTNTVVPDGNYVVRMESADQNAGSAGQNNQGTFPFTVGPNAQKQTGLSGGGFSGVTVDYNLLANSCGNGTVEAGETCDGSCVTSCPDLGIQCYESVVVGSASACNAECITMEITYCSDGDGCCPAGCDGMDAECPGGNGSGSDGGSNDLGGCDTSGGAGWLPFGLFGAALLLFRRRV